MELPICNVTYSNDCEASEVNFLNCVMKTANEYLQYHRLFFTGLCYFCNDGDFPHLLHQCEGCQLVSYCSHECQKNDRLSHEHVCKEFPVVNGFNALYTTGPWKEHIAGLCERAALLPDAENYAKPIFRNPRVCNTCREARIDRLFDCECACVMYCSKICEIADIDHQKDCNQLDHISTSDFLWYDPTFKFFLHDKKACTKLQPVSVCTRFQPVSCYSEVIPKHVALIVDPKTELQPENSYGIDIELRLAQERLMNPMSLIYALQNIPEQRLGQKQCDLENVASLTIHVVYSSPLFDSQPWEAFMHQLPKLWQLNVVFVMQGKPLKQSFSNHNAQLSLQRCNDCKDKSRIITYSVHQMQYHMFFSSQEYLEPDVVVIYGNAKEMLASGEDELHSQISYCNMIFNPCTILVLMDETKDLVNQGINAVNLSQPQPVVQLVSPRDNPFKGKYLDRSEIDFAAITHENCYFTCLKKQIIDPKFTK